MNICLVYVLAGKVAASPERISAYLFLSLLRHPYYSGDANLLIDGMEVADSFQQDKFPKDVIEMHVSYT